MNVLSLFDGMSCGQIALFESGFKINKYYSCEVDKFAIKQTQHNFPDTIQLGDVTDLKAKEIDKIDLLIGGSPCQGFSFAGKQLNFRDPQSALFFEFVRLWEEIKAINPQAKFLLENVNMKKGYQKVINDTLGIFPVRINSNLVSAQNRDRLYWTNIRTKQLGLFGEIHTDIPQPEDQKLFIKDILQPEEEIDNKYYVSEKVIKSLLNRKKKHEEKGNGFGVVFKTKQNKSDSLLSRDYKGSNQIIKLDKELKEKPVQNKASCFTAGGSSGGNHSDSDMDIICVPMVGRRIDKNGIRKDHDRTIPAVQRLESVKNGDKTNCLTSVSKDNLILQKPRGKNKGGVHQQKTPTLTSSSFEQNNVLQQNDKLRRLTPTECAILQTIPDWYKWIVSDSQQYKMLGNGWTIEVIKHIFSFIKK